MKTKSITTVLFITFLLGLSVFQSCNKSDLPPIDGDGQTYSTIEINGKTWFAENLNYKTPNSWCYNDSAANGDVYGRLYTWNDAINACPKGWHLPSNEEFKGVDGEDLHTKMAGMRYVNGSFGGLDGFTCWWQSNEHNSWDQSMYTWWDYDGGLNISNYGDKQYGQSIRCIKD